MPNSNAAIYALQARWVLPIDRPPIAGGIVTIAGGTVAAVGENLSGSPPRDLGDVALLPGLVNAHAHLEFSDLAAPLGEPGTPFPTWIGQVVRHRRSADKQAAVAQGLAESAAAGVAAIGEIATPGWPREGFAGAALQAIVFLELLGLAPSRQEPLLALAGEHVAAGGNVLGDYALGGYAAGLSPHAPYTIGPQLLSRLCELSAASRVPLAMHLAESLDELELLQSHSGALVEVLRSLDAWHPQVVPRGIEPRDYLELLAGGHRALVIHGNFLAPSDWSFLAARRARMSVVYCPRTHAFFGHGRYPLADMLAAGVRVAVGTDSRASNPDLRLLEELRHIARQHSSIPPDEVLKMGTLYGAEALGLADRWGSIAPGKAARLAIVPIDAAASDPHEAALGTMGDAVPIGGAP